jgi:hypothetical protein
VRARRARGEDGDRRDDRVDLGERLRSGASAATTSDEVAVDDAPGGAQRYAHTHARHRIGHERGRHRVVEEPIELRKGESMRRPRATTVTARLRVRRRRAAPRRGRALPREVGKLTAEVPVRCGLRVDRAEEVEVVDDRLRTQVEDVADRGRDLLVGDVPVPNVSTYSPTGSAPDRVGDLHLEPIREPAATAFFATQRIA